MKSSPITALEKLTASRKTSSTPSLKRLQLSLPLWPDAVRGVPNAVLRGALFGVSKTRATAKRLTLLTAVEGIEISFKGERFNQVDLDLLEMLLHLARTQPLGNKVEFASHAILKELGRGTAGKDHEDLRNGIARLAGGVVDIKWTTGPNKNQTVGGALVSTYARDDETGRNVVVLNKQIVTLYDSGYTYIDWDERKALGNNSLAKWLHGFYASHAKPYDYKVETLKDLCGSTVARLTEFRRMLRQALAHLEAVGAIKSWSIDDDLVQVINLPSKTQAKHLAKKVKARGLTHKSKAITAA